MVKCLLTSRTHVHAYKAYNLQNSVGKIISFVQSFLNYSFHFILLAHPSQVLIPHAVYLSVLLPLFVAICNIRTVPLLTLLTCISRSYIISCPIIPTLFCHSFQQFVLPSIPTPFQSSSSSHYKTSLISFFRSAVSLVYSSPILPVLFPMSLLALPSNIHLPLPLFCRLQSFPNPSVLFIFFFHFSRACFPALLFLGLIDIFFSIYSGNDVGVFSTVTGPTQTHKHRHATVRLNPNCVQFRNVNLDAKYAVSTILSSRTIQLTKTFLLWNSMFRYHLGKDWIKNSQNVIQCWVLLTMAISLYFQQR